jgi:death-on-curing protein
MNYVSIEEVVFLHQRIIEKTGGQDGIQDFGLLHSAIERPKASFGGQDLYPDIFSKAAALVYSLINNDPFIDGNKRTGLMVMIRFLFLNNQRLVVDNKRLVDLGLSIANKKMNIEDIKIWLNKNCK